MRPVLLDASVYISALHRSRTGVLSVRSLGPHMPVWLSAVVLEELYAGSDDHSRRWLGQMERDFDRTGRILVPNFGDWVRTGKVLARLAATCNYEHIGRGRLTNDALIATSAARLGITVITANVKDFARLAEFCPFRWTVSQI